MTILWTPSTWSAASWTWPKPARRLKIPLIMALGTGNKLDPSRLQITDISKTYGCPLARVMRKELRSRGIHHQQVVFSPEEPIPTAQLEAPPQGGAAFPPAIPGFLRRQGFFWAALWSATSWKRRATHDTDWYPCQYAGCSGRLRHGAAAGLAGRTFFQQCCPLAASSWGNVCRPSSCRG